MTCAFCVQAVRGLMYRMLFSMLDVSIFGGRRLDLQLRHAEGDRLRKLGMSRIELGWKAAERNRFCLGT